MVLEEYESAKARGATIIAEVMGFGMTADAGDMVHPKVEGAAGAMQLALKDAGLKAAQIDYINAHGTATKTNDVTETRAIKSVFGDAARTVAISSTKSMHGHMLGGGSLVEGAACIMAQRDNFIPPTINLNDPDPDCDLDYTPNEGREREVTYTMNNSLAFGGMNTVIIFGPAPE
jgi:nodulation protein E